jgi:hypothetical protein
MAVALRRGGIAIGRDQTGRLMRELGLAGARRGKTTRTTVPDSTARGVNDCPSAQTAMATRIHDANLGAAGRVTSRRRALDMQA